MFTGRIETIGAIEDLRRSDKSVSIGVRARRKNFDVCVGASVSINGVCLTVESIVGDVMFFTAVQETLLRTTVIKARQGEVVNLERALMAGGRLDGHFVLGHVDAIGTIAADRRMGASIVRRINTPRNIRKLLARKGSVAIDGVSLTIAECWDDAIEISLIPQTLKETTMGLKNAGSEVNIECDVLARYIERLLGHVGSYGGEIMQFEGSDGSLLDKLEGAGF
jgi:riboflavin synthase